MRAHLLALALLGSGGCTLGLTSDPTPEPGAPLAIPDLWAGAFPNNARITIAEAVVISPATAAGTTFYVQHPGGGPASGLQVHLGDGVTEWPPAVGSLVKLSGTTVLFAGGPTMWLKDEDDLSLLPGSEEPVATEWSEEESSLSWTLVHASSVTITSSVDPAGLASTDLGPKLRPDFGAPTPGWNRTGDLTAIQALAGALLLRSADDWTGDFDGDPPLSHGATGLIGLADGTPLRIDDLVQATEWSVGDRYAVLQDPSGNGVWVDAEGFGAPLSALGDVGSWVGELRFGGDGMRLRVWTDPELAGTRTPLEWPDDPLDAPAGALVQTTVANLSLAGPRGERAADNWLLDNRFTDLLDLTDPADVRGAVRVGEDEIRRLAVLP